MIFIKGNTPSSKNGRVFNTKRLRSFDSPQTAKYKKASKQDYLDNKEAFLKKLEGKSQPYKVGLHFVRESRRKYDWVNPVQTVQDFMVANGWIEDDNTSIMFPFPLEIDGVYTTYDKENPGVYIEVL